MTAVLRLSLMTPLGDSPDQQKRMLTEGSLKIGRDESNDWSLDDNSRLISRHHCTITANGGLFIIIDSSANGLFINDAKQPLGRGNSAILSNGDVLRMGNLAISIEVAEQLVTDADPFRAVLPKLGSPSVPQPEAAADPLGAPLSAAVFASMASAPPPDWESFGLRPLPTLTPQVEEIRGTETIADHLPAEQEALLPLRVVSSQIPEDWDLDAGMAPAAPTPARFPSPAFPAPTFSTPEFPAPEFPAPDFPTPSPSFGVPVRAEPTPPPEEASPPAPAKSAVGVALVEALARIEAAVVGEFEPAILAGPPEQVLARLESEEGDWIGLTLTSLAARVISRLNKPEDVSSQSETATPQEERKDLGYNPAAPYIPEGDLS